jgi:hypothetical protein
VRAGAPNSPGTCSYCPYLPKCLERLSGNSERAPFCGLRSLRDGVRDALFDALCHTDKRAVRPVQLLSRQSLEEVFSEVHGSDLRPIASVPTSVDRNELLLRSFPSRGKWRNGANFSLW